VPDTDIQIVSNEAGEPTAVIVPIELWREIASERETAYLLKSAAMKQRLLAAAQRQDGLSLNAVVEKLGMGEAWNSIPRRSRI
jgi:antitoxin YefM